MSPLPVHLAITMPGGSELLLILLIVLVVFGHNRIPQLGDALGKGIKNFRKSFAKDESEAEVSAKEVRPVVEERAADRQLPEGQGPAAERLSEKVHQEEHHKG